MEWKTVKLENKAKGRTMPYASIGFGRISLSAGACRLLENYKQYKWAELLQGEKNGKPCVGVRFLLDDQRTDNSIPLKQKKQKTKEGESVGGLDIANKKTLEKLFGPAASGSSAERYNVTLDEDDKKILIIFKD